MFGMHKPRRFFINYKPNDNLCTMSFWVSIYIYFFFIMLFIYLFFLPNKLYIIIIIIIYIYIYIYINDIHFNISYPYLLIKDLNNIRHVNHKL